MTVNKTALFAVTKSLWPATIDLSQDPSGPNDIYWALETIVRSDDDWQQIAMWSFHQALAELQKQAMATGSALLSPHAVSFADFDKWMRANLAGDKCWAAEQVVWGGDTDTKQ